MDLKKAIDILELHNKWRRDNTGEVPFIEPKVIGEAIDLVVDEYKSNALNQNDGCPYCHQDNKCESGCGEDWICNNCGTVWAK